MAYRLDLHTHSVASPDGSLRAVHIRRILQSGRLNGIAITDHDTIDQAQILQNEFGAEHIIIGEEVTTSEGEIIGLYLKKAVPAGLSAAETVSHIRNQGGLVYVPHPFETVRKGVTRDVLDTIAKDVDIIEVFNGRAIFQNFGTIASKWAEDHNVAAAASSDAHGMQGWGRTYSILNTMPTRETLVHLLQSATYTQGTVGMLGLAYPKLNRIRKRGTTDV